MTPASAKFRLSRHARFRTIDGEAVVVQQEYNKVILLNDVSTRILELASDGLSFKEITDRLFDEFDAEMDVLRNDTDGHLAELIDAGILRAENGDSPA